MLLAANTEHLIAVLGDLVIQSENVNWCCQITNAIHILLLAAEQDVSVSHFKYFSSESSKSSANIIIRESQKG